jgi:hypothetical protein
VPGFESAKEVDSPTRILAVFLDYGDPAGIAGVRQARLYEGLPDRGVAQLRSDPLKFEHRTQVLSYSYIPPRPDAAATAWPSA